MNINTIFDPDNVVWAFLLKLYYLAFAGLLWFISSLPIITIGAATVSLYSYCFNVLDGNEGYVVRTFFSTFKRVFLQATMVFLLIAVCLAFLVFDAWFFLQQIPMLFFVAISLMLLVLVGSVHVFPLLSRKQQSLKNSTSFFMYLGVQASSSKHHCSSNFRIIHPFTVLCSCNHLFFRRIGLCTFNNVCTRTLYSYWYLNQY